MRTPPTTAEPEEPAFGGVISGPYAVAEPNTSCWWPPFDRSKVSPALVSATVYFYGDRPTTIPLTQFGTTDAFAPGVVYFYPREQAP